MDDIVQKRLLQAGNLVFAFLTIGINIAANALPLNNKNTGVLSDNLPNLFVPSGLTFAIWGIIYVLWIVFALYQARDWISKKDIPMPYLKQIHGFFIISSLANIAWIFLWHYEYPVLCLLPMIILLLSLLAIYQRLGIGKTPVSRNEKLAVHVPFSVYLGWITVATIANVTGALITLGYDGLPLGTQQLWTYLVLAVGVLIGLLVLWQRKDIAYAFVLVWAYFGILIKRLGTDPLFGEQTTIAAVAGFGCLIILIVIALVALQQWKAGCPLIKKT